MLGLELDEEHVNLSSLKDAERFLRQFDWYAATLEESVERLRLRHPALGAPPPPPLGPEQVRAEVVKHWSGIISQLPLERRQDRFLQNVLTAALENVILSRLHERVFSELSAQFHEEDTRVFKHCQHLTRVNLSPALLGVPEGFVISFPAAVVELAALDMQTCPLDKLNCLRASVEYLEAEIKCAIADTHQSKSGEPLVPQLSSMDLVPMLTAVLIQTRPPHLCSNLHYMSSYQQTLTPHDPLCSSLLTFERALAHLLSIEAQAEDMDEEVCVGRKFSKQMTLEELMALTSQMERLEKEKLERAEPPCVTPVECHLERIVGMIEMSTGESGIAKFSELSHDLETDN